MNSKTARLTGRNDMGKHVMKNPSNFPRPCNYSALAVHLDGSDDATLPSLSFAVCIGDTRANVNTIAATRHVDRECPPYRCWLPLMASILFNVGCAKETSSPTDIPAAEASMSRKLPSQPRLRACDLVKQAEMSTILGGPVQAETGGNEHPPGSTECIYSSVSGSGPAAELEVDWDGGDLRALSFAASTTGSLASGEVDRLRGIGERAWHVAGSQVFISTQGHLMIIRFSPDVEDIDSKARRIHATVKDRL
jgi:hypothetical protein